mgnify:CR=1 FL=1
MTGPARGYVARGLERLGVPYAHDYVEDYFELAERYPALDVYLNCSREEGGPKGIIEAMAASVPVVSTRVGMAPDIIVHGRTGWLADSDDAASLARWVSAIEPQSEEAIIARLMRERRGERIGLLAPLLVVAGRLVQGLSAGVEVGGASVYLAEIAPKDSRGFYSSFQTVTMLTGQLLALGLLIILQNFFLLLYYSLYFL